MTIGNHLVDNTVLTIITRAAEAQKAAPSLEMMAHNLSCSTHTIQSGIKRLVEAGKIEVEMDGSSRRYWLVERRLPTKFTMGGGRPPKQDDNNRKCITCRAPFHSEGSHNRMCVSCRSGKSADAPGYGTRHNGAFMTSFIA